MRQLAISVLFLCCNLNTSGQEENQRPFKVIQRIGIGQSTFPEFSENSGVLRLYVGFGRSYELNDKFSINAECFLGTLGSKYKGIKEHSTSAGSLHKFYVGNINLFALTIPLYPSFTFGSERVKFVLCAGPGINFNLFGSEERSYTDGSSNFGDVENSYKLLHLSAMYGIGVHFKTDKGGYVFFDLRNNTGLTKVYESRDNIHPKQSRADYFSISTGYIF